MSDKKSAYLTDAEKKGVLPQGKKIKRLEHLDRRYECYCAGHEPPTLDESDLTGSRPVYWYDLSLDRVKQFDFEEKDWKLAPKDTPKLAFNAEGIVVGQVDEENEFAGTVRSVQDLLDEEI